jgi:hypothetical protein
MGFGGFLGRITGLSTHATIIKKGLGNADQREATKKQLFSLGPRVMTACDVLGDRAEQKIGKRLPQVGIFGWKSRAWFVLFVAMVPSVLLLYRAFWRLARGVSRPKPRVVLPTQRSAPPTKVPLP